MSLAALYQSLSDELGGQAIAASALGISQPTFSGYVNSRWAMSERVARRAERVTAGKFKAVELCPALKDEFDLPATA